MKRGGSRASYTYDHAAHLAGQPYETRYLAVLRLVSIFLGSDSLGRATPSSTLLDRSCVCEELLTHVSHSLII